MKYRFILLFLFCLTSVFAVTSEIISDTGYDAVNAVNNGNKNDGGDIFLNYTKPYSVVDTIWEVKFGGYDTHNVTIPSVCYSSSPLQLKMHTYLWNAYNNTANSTAYGQCYNYSSSSWVTITNVTSSHDVPSIGTSTGSSSKSYDLNYSTKTCFSWSGGTSMSDFASNCGSGTDNGSWYEGSKIYWNISEIVQRNTDTTMNGSSSITGVEGYVFLNKSQPSNMSNFSSIVWETKFSATNFPAGHTVPENYTIPSECYSSFPIQLKMVSRRGNTTSLDTYSYGQCYNYSSASWTNITHIGYESSGVSNIGGTPLIWYYTIDGDYSTYACFGVTSSLWFISTECNSDISKWFEGSVVYFTGYEVGATCGAPSINNDWNVTLSDGCSNSATTNLGSGSLRLSGAGTFLNSGVLTMRKLYMTCTGSCSLKTSARMAFS